jgi:glycosyltransferase involved in cell wall biosynthesis
MKVAFVAPSLTIPEGYGSRTEFNIYKGLRELLGDNLTTYSTQSRDLVFPGTKLCSCGVDSEGTEIDPEEYDAVLNCTPLHFRSPNVVHYDYGHKHVINDTVVSESEAYQAKIGNRLYAYGSQNPKVVHIGTDIDYFKFQPNKEDYFVYFGRIHPSKGAELAVKIAEATGIKLKVAGDDCECDRGFPSLLKFIADLKEYCSKLPNVEYIGHVTNSEAVDILGRARASIYPIQGIFQFDQTVIETMSCGTPVLVSDRPAPRDNVDSGVTGFIAPSDSMGDWKAIIDRVGELDPYKVRQVAEEKWSYRAVARNFMALFEQVARGETW